MRRIMLLVAGVLALALAAPGIASAHGRHHHRHHHVKAHHARTRHIGARSANDPSTPGTPATGDAGTVASFTGGVLTITLADGSTVTGTVTDQTEIECETAAPTTPAPTASTADDHGDQGDGQGEDGQGDSQGGDGQHCQGQSACTVADLIPGAVVHEADLRIGSGGSVFEKVTLVKQGQTQSS